MNDYALQPPNSQLLSDRVIGGVVERSWSSQRSIAPQISAEIRPGTSVYRSQRPGVQGEREFSLKRTSRGPWETHRDTASSLKSVPNLLTTEDQYLAFAKIAISEKIRLRELRRMRQVRYRKKKENYVTRMDEEAAQLRQEIEKLEQRRRSLATGVPTEMNVWSVVAEFFRLFRYGMPEPPFEAQSESQSEAQLEFIRTSFTADVAFNASYGVDKMIENWQQTSRWFPSIEVELEGLDKGPAGSLVATTTTTISISEQTLGSVFPHLLYPRDTLADTLLDQTLTMQGSMHFEWDDSCHRITRVTSLSDMLTPMLHFLGGLEEVARVFQQAAVTPDLQARRMQCKFTLR
ncbi:bzip transcription factor [Phytophthora infestans T30-4]|uniref:Bzip transcription factor n=1 Tax=Phytophthora infestans (strain T30-4) TaxID=403677 RepID=D0NUC2_PHYIT|nr:bzip transcription factor [Phytophthora infestans T30-4]EEY65255.1 bzip transcription factor [Phytophthora infestans T30-4]|eukprot:XP_002897319.1 bzip transcription factor [Phytophthora infestans T30-4]